MTYGHQNSGLVFAKFAVLGFLIFSFIYILLYRIHFFKTPVEVWYLSSIVYIYIVSSFSVNSTIMISSLNYFMFTVLALLFFNALFLKYEAYFVSSLAKINVFICCFAILIGFYVILVGPIKIPLITIEYDLFFSKRMNSWFNNSTVLGMYIAVCFCFLIYLNKARLISPLLFYVISILFWSGLIVSGGRTGVLVTLIAYFLMYFQFKFNRTLVLYVSFVLLVCLILAVNLDYLTEHVYFIRRVFDSGNSGLGGRDDKLDFAVKLINQYDIYSILFGQGQGSVLLLHNFSIHSGSLREILELGVPFTIVSFLVGISIIFSSLFILPKKHNHLEYRLVSSLLAVLVLSDVMVTSLWGISLMSLFYTFSICYFSYIYKSKGTLNAK